MIVRVWSDLTSFREVQFTTKFLPEDWREKSKEHDVNGETRVTLDDWKSILTAVFAPGAREAVSFREIAVYLIRVGKAAYAEPLTAFQGQPGPSKRMAISYLLGLNWTGQKSLLSLIESRSQVGVAIKALQTAGPSVNEKTVGELDAERVRLEKEVAARRIEVESFNVRDDYNDLQNSLEKVDRSLHDLINENYSVF